MSIPRNVPNYPLPSSPGARQKDPPPLIYWKPLTGAVLFMLVLVLSATAAVTRGKSTRAALTSTPEDPYAFLPPEPLILKPARPAEPEPIVVKSAFKPASPDSVVGSCAKPDPLFGAIEPAAPVVVVPEAIKNGFAPETVTPKETFGTAVRFERNLLEAVQVAKHHRKLLFLLHVSGNFEDQEFT